MTRKTTLYFFRKCLFEHSEYMFIYLKLNGNKIILGNIMVIDAHLKNVNCVSNMKKIHCRNNQRPNRNTPHTNTWPLGLAPGFLHYKKGALDSKPLVIKITSCLPMVDGSLRVLRLLPPQKLVAMM